MALTSPASPPCNLAVHDAARLPGPLPGPLLASARPVLYTHTLCPYAQRVFMTLLLKAPPSGFDVVHVDLSDKPRWYTSTVNRRGLVPAVVWRDATLLESLDVCRELDRLLPDAPLAPAAPAAARQVQQLLQAADGIVAAGLDVVAGSTARHWGVGSRPSAAQQRRWEAACQQLARPLQGLGGPFLAGGQPSLADVALAPFFERFRLCLQLTQGDDLSRVCGGSLAAWLDAMATLPACALTSPDAGLFTQALRQHASLDFFDFETYGAAQLHPQLEAYCV